MLHDSFRARRSALLLAVLALAAFALTSATALAGRGGQLTLTVTDRDTGQPIACRMHLRNARGVAQKPPKGTPFWHDHFVFAGTLTLKLPNGEYDFDIERGPEYLNRTGHFTINDFAEDSHAVDLKRVVNMAQEGWWSGDLNVQRPEKDMALLMDAEDLHLAQLIAGPAAKIGKVVSKTATAAKTAAEQGVAGSEPWIQFPGEHDLLRFGQADASGGNLLLVCNLRAPLSLPPSKPSAPFSPAVILEAREQSGAWFDVARAFGWELPVLVAHGWVDSIELANSHLGRTSVQSDEAGGKPRDPQLYAPPSGIGRWNAAIYYHLLNCGLRVPPSAGSGSGDGPNPVGYNRAYVHIDGAFTVEKWFAGLKAGQVVVTNGPLLRTKVEGELPGHVFQGDAGQELELEIGLTLSTRETVHYLEIIKDGRVAHSIRLDDFAKQGGRLPKLKFRESGWFLVRAVTDTPKTYRFATSAPYYVQIGYQPRISKASAQFFLDWVNERGAAVKIDDEEQRGRVNQLYDEARKFWEGLVAKANAE